MEVIDAWKCMSIFDIKCFKNTPLFSFTTVTNLAQPGTFAGNDAIVAFARSQQVKVVIHQLNAPLWEVGVTTGRGNQITSHELILLTASHRRTWSICCIISADKRGGEASVSGAAHRLPIRRSL